MDKTRQIIISNEKKFPHFAYYLGILDKIEENVDVMPDVAIESCKSLFEGISKTILDTLKEPYVDKGRSADSPDNLVRKAIDKLSTYSAIDLVFAHSVCGFVKRMSDVRNERGDISHGKAVPKKTSSDAHLSNMVSHTTDGMAHYILSVFFNAELPDFSEINYDSNSEFNEFLDSENELSGVKYSRALFDQDPISYKEQYNNYFSERGE